FHHRVNLVADLRDLSPSEVLVSAMVVQSQYSRKPAPRAGRFEQHRLCRGPVRKLPAQVLDVQPAVLELMLELGLGSGSGVGLQQATTKAVTRQRTPAVEVVGRKARVSKGKPCWSITSDARRPRTIGANHVGVHQIHLLPCDPLR